MEYGIRISNIVLFKCSILENPQPNPKSLVTLSHVGYGHVFYCKMAFVERNAFLRLNTNLRIVGLKKFAKKVCFFAL